MRNYDVNCCESIEEQTEKQISAKAHCMSAKSGQVYVTFVLILFEEAPYLDHTLDKYDA